MFYIFNSYGNWLQPVVRWYHGNPTFTDTLANAGQFTAQEADTHMQNPKMPAGAYIEAV